MSLFLNIGNKLINLRNEALSLPSKVKEKAKTKYVDLGKKLLVSVLNQINRFARHIIVLQGKDPDHVPPPVPTVKDAVLKRPSFRFNETNGWTHKHFKPGKHPILVLRNKLAQEGGLQDKSAEELTAKAVAEFEVLQRTLVPETASKQDPIEELRSVVSEFQFDEIVVEDTLHDKAVRVNKTKKGVFHRVED